MPTQDKHYARMRSAGQNHSQTYIVKRNWICKVIGAS